MDINFKAQYIMLATIQKRDKNCYKKYDAGFYKLDPENKSDRKIISTIAQRWGDSYAKNICDYFYNIDGVNKNQTYIYVISDTVTKPAELTANNILGIAELRKKSDIENSLDFLQVKPSILKNKKYKNIGTEMLDAIKQLHFETPLYVFSDEDAIEFYIKNDFKRVPNSEYSLYWEA